MSYNEYIANANMALASAQFESALDYAQKAIKLEPKQSEGFYSAGKACMSMNRVENAEDYFQRAVALDKNNGNGYFLLGYAQAMANKPADALQNMTMAIENNCDDSLRGQVYKLMSVINMDQQDFDNALINLQQAESFIGLDYEILQQKAACYASRKDYHKTIFTLNQMKLLRPNDYMAYSLAFQVFMELGIYEEAEGELSRAADYADLNMAYYNDCVAYTLFHHPKDDTEETMKNKWKEALILADKGIHHGNPDVEQVFELYLRAAQLHLSLEQADEALACLDAAGDPVYFFNHNFSILQSHQADGATKTLVTTAVSPDEEEDILQERWDDGEFDEIRGKIEDALSDTEGSPEEIAGIVQKCLSPIDKIPSIAKEDTESYILTDTFSMEPLQKDMRNSIYLSVYELKKDYEKMLQTARELQSSSITGNQYLGMYYELKVSKYRNVEHWQKRYHDRIRFWTKRMLEEPTDHLAASYRIRSYIDLEEYDEAERLCSCLPVEVKEALMEEIREAKVAGGDENGNMPG